MLRVGISGPMCRPLCRAVGWSLRHRGHSGASRGLAIRLTAPAVLAHCEGSYASARGAASLASWPLGAAADAGPSCVAQIMFGAGDSPKLLACASAIRKDESLLMGISR